MATRSATIEKARQYLLQGSNDPHWSDEDWNDYYHDALDMICDEIDAENLPYLIVSEYTLTKDASDRYPLPDGFKTMLRVQETSGQDVYPLRKNNDFQVYERENEFLLLRNWETALPATLKIRYRQLHPYLGDWDGTPDATTVVPQEPLDNARGSRLIARLLNVYAKAKDEDLTPDETDLAKGLIDKFVSRIGGTEDESILQEIGT